MDKYTKIYVENIHKLSKEQVKHYDHKYIGDPSDYKIHTLDGRKYASSILLSIHSIKNLMLCPLTTSLAKERDKYLRDKKVGIEQVFKHGRDLVDRIQDSIKKGAFELELSLEIFDCVNVLKSV